MKKSNFIVWIMLAASLQACNSSNSDSVTVAKDSNEVKIDSSEVVNDNMAVSTTPVDKDAADFAVEVANGGMMEVALGNYAQQNAMDSRVKDFGAMMVRDHTQANDALKSLAAAKNITLPASVSDAAQKDMDNLMKKKGKDFDKAYMSMMLDDHKKNVKKFDDASKNCTDADLKNFAMNTLPVIMVHLDSVKAITGKK